MQNAVVLSATLALILQPNPGRQTGGSIVGTWRLASASALTADRRVVEAPVGASPAGLLTYTQDGRMSAMISHGGRSPLTGDRISSPLSERAAAFATFLAYAGRYTVSDVTVIHHVEISSVPNCVNTDLVRRVTLDGDRLTLRTPPLSVGGTIQTTELTWQQIK